MVPMDTNNLSHMASLGTPTTAPSRGHEPPSALTAEQAGNHQGNLGALLSLAEKQYEARLQATDGLDNKLGLVLAAISALLVAATELTWSPRWYQISLGLVWLSTILTACGCGLVGLGPRGYRSTDLRKFRAKYTTEPQSTFTDRLLTEYTDHIEANTGINARKARLFTWALRFGALALLFYALEVAIEKHV